MVNIGKLTIEAVYEVLSGKKEIYEMPRTLVAPEIRYAKEDLDNYVPWQKAAEQLNNCSLPNGVVQFNK